MTDTDLPRVREIYAQGIATRQATFETEAPPVEALAEKWLPGHRWVAELAESPGEVVGWTGVSPTSTRACYVGVGESAEDLQDFAAAEFVGALLGDFAPGETAEP